MHGAVTHATLRLRLAQIGALFGSKNAIFVKHKYTWDLIDHVKDYSLCEVSNIDKYAVIMATLKRVGISGR